ncbi:hypothetical protein PIROE2DRAFT_13358 [Piromyces sp. E2]|nr:hypothetical protein PIROE2DRAFT_13358 [Piromyces sp. E2]|eukprot:OUM60802.1 hypothetical protein PIROE2DRAFT_13358 [Piromyces sp. E2]
MGIRGKCFDFLSNLYLNSKARARFLDILSKEFPIKRDVRQGCLLSPILFFNLFINDVLNGCEKYGVIFGVNKGATMVVKSINYENIVKLLIENRVDLNKANTDGDTSLIIVCENGNENIVKRLIEKKKAVLILN